MIDGACDAQFGPVQRAFERCFGEGWERGGAVSVVAGGRIVVELWGGHADAAGRRPWRRDTLVNTWSCTKGIMALAMAMMVERGKLAYERPVAMDWPDFAANGKEAITLDQVMSHQAGLNGLAVPMDEAGLCAWFPYVRALAATAPLWEPGRHCIYHALSYGHLAGEILRRADGRSPGQFVADEIAGPLGLDFFIGLPLAEDHRAAEMIAGPKCSEWVSRVQATAFPHACLNPTLEALAPNRRGWRAAEIPGGNGHGTATAVARMYGALTAGGALDGRRVIGRDGIAHAIAPRFRGIDESLAAPASFAAGFQLEEPDYGSRASPQTFGHSGWGGALGFADPEAGIGFGYVTNHMLGFDDGADPRRRMLIDALYDSF